MKHLILAFLGLVLAAGTLKSAQGPEPQKEELVDQVKRSIDKGVQFLRSQQGRGPRGSWEVNLQGVSVPGGSTALTLLALLNAGVPANDPAIQHGLQYLRDTNTPMTYYKALQTMVYAEAAQPEDRQRIVANVKWLIENRVMRDGQFIGWSYSAGAKNTADGSNTQYAVLGLLAGKQGGAIISEEVWKSIREFYVRTQMPEGTWGYSGNKIVGHSPLTMTEAGICGLLVAAMELNSGREIDNGNGTFKNCGVYPEDEQLKKGLSWMGRRGNFQIQIPQATFYNIYGIERVGRLSGSRFIGPYDWYREGADWLVKKQHGDGHWSATGAWDNWPVVSTSFALLFLSKGRTPVLISKLVHGPRDGNNEVTDTDWNNDRNDIKNLTAFASKNLFHSIPLAWQTFDVMRALEGSSTETRINEVTSELAASPIVYFNGHKSPLLRFDRGQDDGGEKRVLKNYLENGGFIFAEACCGSPDFHRGFVALCEELWGPKALKELDGNHPVWQTKFLTTPGRVSKLMGINLGCKTVLIYSPQDLSCRWESNKLDDPLNKEAFELGANIIAYATGLEPPQPRGTKISIGKGGKDPTVIPRGYFSVGQITKYVGDAKVAPKAMRNLMERMNRDFGLDVELKTKADLSPYDDQRMIDYKFLYLHGRSQFGVDQDPEALKPLRFNLENGGLLLADAACGKEVFDESFRKFVKKLFPEPELQLQRIPITDELFSKDLNGEALSDKNIKCRTERNGPMRNLQPWLEGVKYKNRWVVIYSRFDIGCALEKHQSSDCVGYDPESAYRLAAAAVLYALRP